MASRVIASGRRWVQTLAIRHFDPIFADRHPTAFETAIVRALGPVVRLLQPNDRWSLPAFLRDWARIATATPRRPLPPSKRIVMFGCYRGQFTRDLVLACLLAWRGHQVTCCYLPKLRSPIKPPLADSPDTAAFLRRAMAPLERWTHGRVRTADISSYAQNTAAIDEAYLETQTRADVVMCVRQEHYDPKDPETAEAIGYYAKIGRIAQQAAGGFLDAHRGAFDLAVVANGASFESGHFCAAALARGVPVVSIEKFAFARAIVVNHGGAFYHFSDLARVWSRREALGLGDAVARRRLVACGWALLDQRRGTTGGAWGWQYQKAKPRRSEAELRAMLGIGSDQFVLVCPNVPFDAGYEAWLTMFPSMRTWLVETLKVLLAAGQRVVVRAHPAEARPGYGREPIATILAEAGLSHPRLSVLPGDSDVNTYDLMPLCAFGCVFGSTVGIELAMHGKRVVAGADVYYARLGITEPASDRAEYLSALERLMHGTTAPAPNLADDAAAIYALFHYFLQWPFPYDKPSQISNRPPFGLFAEPGAQAQELENYVETLDTLAMAPAEFEAALPALVRFERLAARWGLEDFMATTGEMK